MSTFESNGDRSEATPAPENTGAQNIVQEQVSQYKQENLSSANRPLGEKDVQSLDFSADIYGTNNRVCTPTNPYGRDSSTQGAVPGAPRTDGQAGAPDQRTAEAPRSPGAPATPSSLERIAGAVTNAQSSLPSSEAAKAISGVKSVAASGVRAASPALDYAAAGINAVKGDLPAASDIFKKAAFQTNGAAIASIGCSAVPHPVVQMAKPLCAAVGMFVAGQVYDLTRPRR